MPACANASTLSTYGSRALFKKFDEGLPPGIALGSSVDRCPVCDPPPAGRRVGVGTGHTGADTLLEPRGGCYRPRRTSHLDCQARRDRDAGAHSRRRRLARVVSIGPSFRVRPPGIPGRTGALTADGGRQRRWKRSPAHRSRDYREQRRCRPRRLDASLVPRRLAYRVRS